MAGKAIIQIVKIVSVSNGDVPPKPFRLIETFLTSEGLRTRLCSGCFETIEWADKAREQLQNVIDGIE